jgi:protein-tyrosine phosphatase
MELSWEGCVNVRDLGGLGRVQPGVVVRMEAPTRLTEAGWAAAWAYGVRTVIDLRNHGERPPDEVTRPAGITTVAAPLEPAGTPFYDRWTKIDNFGTPLHYPALLTEHPELMVNTLRAIIDAKPGCVVFHCIGGKDRAGLLALMLLVVAGATPEEIIADYLLTYERLRQVFEDLGHGDQLAAVTKFLAARDTTIEASLTATIEAAAVFLSDELSTAELAALRARLTRHGPG